MCANAQIGRMSRPIVVPMMQRPGPTPVRPELRGLVQRTRPYADAPPANSLGHWLLSAQGAEIGTAEPITPGDWELLFQALLARLMDCGPGLSDQGPQPGAAQRAGRLQSLLTECLADLSLLQRGADTTRR